MKLNPPETAPKDGSVILVWFGKYKTPLPVTWSDNAYMWVVDVGARGAKTHLFPDSLRGWLPMPQIDEEGNVT